MSIKSLRKVVDLVDKFQPEDHNDHVDNWNTQLSINKQLSENIDDPDLQSLLSQLSSLVSSMRKIKPGDFYYADDHNKFVDAWSLQVQINSMLTELITPFKMDSIYVVPVAQIVYEYSNQWLYEATGIFQPYVVDISTEFMSEQLVQPSPQVVSDDSIQFISESYISPSPEVISDDSIQFISESISWSQS